ncbi:MAG TPA: 50S ribosomal protein L21 [Candidatus Marinimicrobia bacterium]|jgi:large subunit ribosomal protein L21|nr:50S ribosomal protein L21 [Candidatus Neomarinimicrobiota bacterium]HHZ99943.1 50S ribosomal protein L21 [Candidatus Neomarinimicrobiota bacterium]HIB02587.1 50S ribosomal protein L21 [Candidatus Neomarinimicrobiota bacterium]HIB70068.1 50S ribosomal protein L21 [Candidatus Neomarinimicrobiota bacterium]HIB95063.1 50S ribosomal protein L21 [Candidatus Neomarinimicrobiota bacterium]
MYVIVDISGKQFRAEEGQELKVPHQKEKPGKKVFFERVLLVDNGKGVAVGQPIVTGSKVEATILEHGRGKKVPVFKKKRRKGYKVKNTHRQEFTLIRVDNIKTNSSKKKTTKKKAKNEAKGD